MLFTLYYYFDLLRYEASLLFFSTWDEVDLEKQQQQLKHISKEECDGKRTKKEEWKK